MRARRSHLRLRSLQPAQKRNQERRVAFHDPLTPPTGTAEEPKKSRSSEAPRALVDLRAEQHRVVEQASSPSLNRLHHRRDVPRAGGHTTGSRITWLTV